MIRHPNRLPFSGVLTLIGLSSEKSPTGALGHRVLLTRDAAVKALPSLIGMGVNYAAGWDGHDATRKIGIITEAAVFGKELRVRGFLYANDFKAVVQAMQQPDQGVMGMSYEVHDAKVEDMTADVWRLTRFTFTGAAILLAERSAYRGTSFRIDPKVEFSNDWAVALQATPESWTK